MDASVPDADGAQVFCSGDKLAHISNALIAANPGNGAFEVLCDAGHSANKGPEPESASLGSVDDRDLLVTGDDVGIEWLNFFSKAQGSSVALANQISQDILANLAFLHFGGLKSEFFGNVTVIFKRYCCRFKIALGATHEKNTSQKTGGSCCRRFRLYLIGSRSSSRP